MSNIKHESETPWTLEARAAAKDFVENNKDGEVRRMYSHHFQSFMSGALWSHEKMNAIRSESDALLKERELKKELESALIHIERMLPYVKGAYECAFPDQSENEWVIEQSENFISKHKPS